MRDTPHQGSGHMVGTGNGNEDEGKAMKSNLVLTPSEERIDAKETPRLASEESPICQLPATGIPDQTRWGPLSRSSISPDATRRKRK